MKAMKWKIGEAKEQLSEVIHRAKREAQILCNRDRKVAVVVDIDSWERFVRWQEKKGEKTFAGALDELRTLCAKEDYQLILPERSDRANLFARGKNQRAGRHRRTK